MTQQNARRDDRTLQRRLAELERRLRRLETAPRAGNTSVSHGVFVIQDGGPGGAQLLRAGYLGQDAVSGNDVRGTAIHRPTGEYVMSTWTDAAGGDGGFWAMYDKAQSVIFADDSVSGQGISRPYVGGPVFAPGDTSLWPKCTSSSYATQWYADYYKQHPRVFFSIWARSDSGTSGDVQVTCDGTVTASAAIGSGADDSDFLYLTVPGSHMSYHRLTIDARRTGGSGFLGVYPMAIYGVQSA